MTAEMITKIAHDQAAIHQVLSGILSVLEQAQAPEQGVNPFDQLTEALLQMDEAAANRHEILVNSINELTNSLAQMVEVMAGSVDS